MVEGKCNFVSEDTVLQAIQYGHEGIKDLIKLQNTLTAKLDIKKREVSISDPDSDLIADVNKYIDGKISQLNNPKNKFDRYNDIDVFITETIEHF